MSKFRIYLYIYSPLKQKIPNDIAAIFETWLFVVPKSFEISERNIPKEHTIPSTRRKQKKAPATTIQPHPPSGGIVT